jgi:hypothetical protein
MNGGLLVLATAQIIGICLKVWLREFGIQTAKNLNQVSLYSAEEIWENPAQRIRPGKCKSKLPNPSQNGYYQNGGKELFFIDGENVN